MTDETRVLNRRKDGSHQLNISIKEELVSGVDNALYSLMREMVGKSKSEIICEAIIEYAKLRGFQA
jgi:hypothetical protein